MPRRFLTGLRNLFSLYRPLVDHRRLFDNSFHAPFCITEEREGQLLVHVKETLDAIPSIL